MIEKDKSKQDAKALIVNLCQREAWQDVKARGVYHAPSLDSEGFIHCLRVGQILKVDNTFYRDVPDMILLWINPNRIKSEVRWETGGKNSFPHIYGPVDINALVKVSDFISDEDNHFRSL